MYMRLDAPQDSVKVGVDQVAHAASDGPHRRRERLLRRRHAQRTAAAQPSTGDFIQPVGLGWYGEFGSRSRLVRSSAARWFGWSAGGRRARSALVASVAAAAALAAAASILALVQILFFFLHVFFSFAKTDRSRKATRPRHPDHTRTHTGGAPRNEPERTHRPRTDNIKHSFFYIATGTMVREREITDFSVHSRV
jgi:hypothetical protein